MGTEARERCAVGGAAEEQKRPRAVWLPEEKSAADIPRRAGWAPSQGSPPPHL